MADKAGVLNVIRSRNTGHNISNYFRFFVDNYDSLPGRMALLKGNIFPRHLSQEFFERVYDNQCYTFLYEDRKNRDKPGIAYQLYDGAFLEINNAWYARARPHKYFVTPNELLLFLFKDPIIPHWLLFSPGACYIVSREQVRKYPAAFYENLLSLVSYTYFPSEAYHVERLLNVIFGANYDLNDWARETDKFNQELEALSERNRASRQQRRGFRSVVGRLKSALKARLQSRLCWLWE